MKIVEFVAYNTKGDIVRTGSVPYSFKELQKASDGESGIVFGAGDPQNNYVDVSTRAIKAKTDMQVIVSKRNIAADGVDMLRINGIPSGSEVFIIGESISIDPFIVNDGALNLTFNAPGKYKIRLFSTKHIRTEEIIYAD